MYGNSEKTKIIIIGGGFAGTKCAKTLSKKLDLNSNEIILFNKENHMVFHPLLAEVVGGILLILKTISLLMKTITPHTTTLNMTILSFAAVQQ